MDVKPGFGKTVPKINSNSLKEDCFKMSVDQSTIIEDGGTDITINFIKYIEKCLLPSSLDFRGFRWTGYVVRLSVRDSPKEHNIGYAKYRTEYERADYESSERMK